jgi:hypothetical protein
MSSHQRLRPAASVVVVLVLLAACTAGGAQGPTGNPSTPIPAPSADPGTGAGTNPGAGGGGVSGNPGSGNASDLPLPVDPTPVEPGAGNPTLVIPRPGQQNVHPVAPTLLQASVDGRHVLVKVSWYGGVEPCSVLDSVKVDKTAGSIALTVLEGSSDPTAICPEIAMLKATIVDLGELEPGAWTITAPGSEATPIQLTID